MKFMWLTKGIFTFKGREKINLLRDKDFYNLWESYLIFLHHLNCKQLKTLRDNWELLRLSNDTDNQDGLYDWTLACTQLEKALVNEKYDTQAVNLLLHELGSLGKGDREEIFRVFHKECKLEYDFYLRYDKKRSTLSDHL